jgi:hypothetical protein
MLVVAIVVGIKSKDTLLVDVIVFYSTYKIWNLNIKFQNRLLFYASHLLHVKNIYLFEHGYLIWNFFYQNSFNNYMLVMCFMLKTSIYLSMNI